MPPAAPLYAAVRQGVLPRNMALAGRCIIWHTNAMTDQQRTRTRSFPINIRTWPQLGERLKAAADDAGLTMTQEVERRLKASFVSDREDAGRLSHAVAAALERANQITGSDWSTDRLTALVAEELIESAVAQHVKGPDNLDELARVYAELDQLKRRQEADVQFLLGAGALESREANALLQFAVERFPAGMFGNPQGKRPSHPYDRLFSPFRLSDAAQVALAKHGEGEELPEAVQQLVTLIEMAAENTRAIEATNKTLNDLWADDFALREKASDIVRAANSQPEKAQADDQEV